MLKRLHLRNFTVFADADFEFVQGLNVLVGTNGTGKSHVLKVGYAATAARYELGKELGSNQLATLFASQVAWTAKLYKILPATFLTDKLGALVRWGTKELAEFNLWFTDEQSEALQFDIHPKSEDGTQEASIRVSNTPSSVNDVARPVFIPAKEILSLSWMLPASEQLVLQIEKNYLDLLSQLRHLPIRNPKPNQAINSLTNSLGGELHEEGDKYFLINKDGKRIAIGMVAEGLRKFGTLQKLLSNGSLTPQSTLFWDEPEANLNPALLRKLAAVLVELAGQGFQIILATHSMSLLKEFHILSRKSGAQPFPLKYFGLNAEPGEATQVVTADNFELLPDVVALEVELEQADDLDEIFAKEDREPHADL
jgi:energy-coupling factor transporter ATP-binding protein EcfA2